ncbi:MAG: hypothetical protein ABDH32_02660 [Candidatus Caldarchaeales archaeon]
MRKKITSEDIISTLFSDEGYHEVGRRYESICIDGQLILSDGRREIIVNILSEESCCSRSTIHEALIEAEKLIREFDGVVLAVPRKFSKVVDEGVLARHGLGLVIYDTMGAEEIVPPKIEDKKQKKELIKDNGNFRDMYELALIKSEILRIIKMLEELEARLDRLEKEQKMIAIRVSEIEKIKLSTDNVKKLVEERNTSNILKDEKIFLPSFIKENPWVEILSRRV